jgi:hypothetical protein
LPRVVHRQSPIMRYPIIVSTFWHGHLMGVFDIDRTDDDVAKEHARQLAGRHEVELWRLVAEFKFEDVQHRPRRRRKAFAP